MRRYVVEDRTVERDDGNLSLVYELCIAAARYPGSGKTFKVCM